MIDRFSPFPCPFMICAMWVIFAFENLSVVLYISSARVSLSADDLEVGFGISYSVVSFPLRWVHDFASPPSVHIGVVE